MIQKQFQLTSKSENRDLAGLALSGCIEFVRMGRTGYYRTTEPQLAEPA